jgi:hypothetical protein
MKAHTGEPTGRQQTCLREQEHEETELGTYIVGNLTGARMWNEICSVKMTAEMENTSSRSFSAQEG